MIDIWRLLAVLLGPVAGSFIGLVSLRLPAGRPVVAGRSACDGCGRTLGVLDLVPLISFAALRGRCRSCGAAIPPRYPLLELAGLAVGISAALAASGPVALAGAVFGWGLLLAAAMDAEHFWLPDAVTLPLGALGLLAGLALPDLDALAGLTGAAAGFAVLWALALAYRRLRGIEGLGGGDPRLFGAIGAWVGWMGLPSVLVWGCLAGFALVAAVIISGRPWSAERRLPFGVFLAIGAWIVWLFGPIGA